MTVPTKKPTKPPIATPLLPTDAPDQCPNDETDQYRHHFSLRLRAHFFPISALRAAPALPRAALPASPAGGTGGATTSAMRENMPRQRRIALPSCERLKKLPHRPRNAIGTTGTGVASTIRSTPGRNGFISPVSVSLPSGKMPTISPVAQRLRGFRERGLLQRRRPPCAGAIGIALHRAEDAS